MKYDANLQLLMRAVVDIGPTTNNGPGDQAKGILNWSASPIVIVAHPGNNKFINVVSWQAQYKPGLSGYVDGTTGTYPQLFLNPSGSGPFYGADSTRYTFSAFGLDGLTPNIYVSQAGYKSLILAVGNVVDQPVVFGDGAAAGELTAGDGHVIITVLYTIEDIF